MARANAGDRSTSSRAGTSVPRLSSIAEVRERIKRKTCRSRVYRSIGGQETDGGDRDRLAADLQPEGRARIVAARITAS
jgi:hypothetical protein